jgi:hypothetical protein
MTRSIIPTSKKNMAIVLSVALFLVAGLSLLSAEKVFATEGNGFELPSKVSMKTLELKPEKFTTTKNVVAIPVTKRIITSAVDIPKGLDVPTVESINLPTSSIVFGSTYPGTVRFEFTIKFKSGETTKRMMIVTAVAPKLQLPTKDFTLPINKTSMEELNIVSSILSVTGVGKDYDITNIPSRNNNKLVATVDPERISSQSTGFKIKAVLNKVGIAKISVLGSNTVTLKVVKNKFNRKSTVKLGAITKPFSEWVGSAETIQKVTSSNPKVIALYQGNRLKNIAKGTSIITVTTDRSIYTVKLTVK